jgi:hypothetical protein
MFFFANRPIFSPSNLDRDSAILKREEALKWRHEYELNKIKGWLILEGIFISVIVRYMYQVHCTYYKMIVHKLGHFNFSTICNSFCLSNRVYLSPKRLNFASSYFCMTVCRKASATEISTFHNYFNQL